MIQRHPRLLKAVAAVVLIALALIQIISQWFPGQSCGNSVGIKPSPPSLFQLHSLQMDAKIDKNYHANVKIAPESSEYFNDHGLDIAVIGFPKTGTTYLLSILSNHQEIYISPQEECDLRRPNSTYSILEYLKEKPLVNKVSSLPIRWGLKCPAFVMETTAIENLATLSNDYTRLVVGVRHPVLFFQSYYNYRVLELYNKNLNGTESIPDPNTLNARKKWKGVTTSLTRFDLFLKQLGKVSLSAEDMYDMIKTNGMWKKRLSSNKFKVFIYTVEQLSDKNATRQAQFASDLQRFLRLKTPFSDFDTLPKSNSNKVIHPEYMDICDAKFDRLRKTLLKNGKIASNWIRNYFILAEDVVVSDADNFRSVLMTWKKDPCSQR